MPHRRMGRGERKRSQRSWGTTGGCPTGKRQFTERKHARQFAKDAKGDHMRPYRCDLCECFHIGHLPQATMMGLLTDDQVYGRAPRPEPEP